MRPKINGHAWLCDLCFGMEVDKRRYASGYAILLFGRIVSEMRKIQSIVSLSTTEVEYMEDTHGCEETI